MFKKAMACASLAALLLAGGCSANWSPTDASPAVVTHDEWFYDDFGAVIIPLDVDADFSEDAVDVQSDVLEFEAMTQRGSIAVACDHFTIVGMEIQPTGKISALEFKAIPGLSMEEGDAFLCKALIVDRAAGEVIIDFGIDGQECCKTLVQMLNGVIRMSCSGDCDNGETCSLGSSMDGGITEFTCACPDVP